MKRIPVVVLLPVLLTGTYTLFAQTYIPVAVTGFNNDVFAESGASATAVTSTVVDGSNHVMYTAAFAAANGVPGGVLNSGAIVSGTRTYQLNPFITVNALYLSAGGNVANTTATGTLTLTTPASFSKISLLAFGTEGNSTLSVNLLFTDGSTASAGTILVRDWFNNTPYVYNGFGRVPRLTAAPYTVNGIPSNPRFYTFDITLACGDHAKELQSVSFSYLSASGTSSRAVILALSGVDHTPLTYTDVITPAVCGGSSGSIALNVTGGNIPVTYSWNTVPAQTTATASNLQPGIYTCAIRDANNCITSYQGTVPQQSAAIITATANPLQVCAGEAATLSATTSGGTITGYTWAAATRPGTTTGTGTIITVTPVTDTRYIVSGQDAFGCTIKDSVDVSVKPTPTADFSALPATVCLGDAHTLNFLGSAGTNAIFNWNNFSGGNVISGSGAGPYNIVFNSAGNYTLQLQVTDEGCGSDIYTQTVTVSAPPVVSFQVSKSPLCAGESTTVTFTGSKSNAATATWSWDGGAVQGGSQFGPFNVSYQRSGNISLTVTDGACTVTSPDIPVTVIPLPVSAFTPDITTGCAALEVTFANQSQHADAYQWQFGNGYRSTAPNPVHPYSTPGIYSVTLVAIAQQQCSDTLTKTALITVLPAPVALFSASPGVNTPVEYSKATFNFSNHSQYAVTYKWDFGDGNTSPLTDPQHRYTLPGNYRVTLFAGNDTGCRDSVSHEWYMIVPDKILRIPNTFSPNGDGINDRWEVDGLKALPLCQVEIYNRWGQIVFKSIGYTPAWDGTRQGKELPVGTYYYVIKTAPGDKPYTGWVALLR